MKTNDQNMKKNIGLIWILTILAVGQSTAQSEIKYPYCNCVEKLNYSTANNDKLEGQYELTCKSKQIVTGQYTKGLRTGKWTIKTTKGATIKNAEYVEGKLNGKYELFYFDGTPKLIARFTNGQHDGLWQYFNEKGKIIKTGSYETGKPIGTWTIFDKGGKKAITAFDFSDKNSLNPSVAPYFRNGGIQRDDQSGEWYIIYYPERNPDSDVQPLGGYSISCDFFLKLLIIPAVMMDTYTNYDFGVTLDVENNGIKNITIVNTNGITYNPKLPALPFIVSTNPPGKLKRIDHTRQSIDLLKDDIAETMNIMGPWIGNSKVDIYIPFVLNDIKKF
jgi:antitoxin component YwqK of YwqJK toxin-antitoxin module